MQYAFFVISVKNTEESEAELNKFLRSHKVLSVKNEFVSEKDKRKYCLRRISKFSVN